MYKIYVDKGFVNKDKIWKKTGESNYVDLVIYDGFSNLILKLDAEDKMIVTKRHVLLKVNFKTVL